MQNRKLTLEDGVIGLGIAVVLASITLGVVGTTRAILFPAPIIRVPKITVPCVPAPSSLPAR
jgi:hypothetical protein